MKSPLMSWTALGAWLAVSPLLAEPPAEALRQPAEVLTIIVPVTVNYLEALPEGYAMDETRRWPLVIFLHGSGERGSD